MLSSDPIHPTVAFVSGANRGIGLEFASQLVNSGACVVAGYRTEASASGLLELSRSSDRLVPIQVDVTNELQVQNAHDLIQERFGYLDLLINNAGVNPNPKSPFHEYSVDVFLQTFSVNVIGPYLVAKTLYPLLVTGRSKTIVNVTSKMGSITLSSGSAEPYRVSKAGLNMLTKSQALEYQRDGLIVVCVHPGWVATDMGGPNASLTTAQSVTSMLKLIAGLSRRDSGKYLSFDGSEIPF